MRVSEIRVNKIRVNQGLGVLSRLVAMNDKTCLFEINNGGHANEQCSWLLKVQTAWADMANV